jgi:hypothetical protein
MFHPVARPCNVKVSHIPDFIYANLFYFPVKIEIKIRNGAEMNDCQRFSD